MSLWEVMVSVLWFCVLLAWIAVLLSILGDLIRDRELSGWGKAGWTLFIIVLPWIGCLTYLVVRGQGMGERHWDAVARKDQALREYSPEAAPAPPPVSTADELAKLADLRQRDAISAEDYDWAKSMLLQPAGPSGAAGSLSRQPSTSA